MKYMIKNTLMTAEQMAIHLHFPDTSYMCRYFKKRTGLSISQFRKENNIGTEPRNDIAGIHGPHAVPWTNAKLNIPTTLLYIF